MYIYIYNYIYCIYISIYIDKQTYILPIFFYILFVNSCHLALLTQPDFFRSFVASSL